MVTKDVGSFVKALRMSRGYGLRQFAEMIDELPSNLSAVEHGRRKLPQSPEKLRRIADALALVEGSAEWERFFFLARQPGQLIAPHQHYADMDFFPVLCRTLGPMQPTEEELSLLVKLLQEHRKKHD